VAVVKSGAQLALFVEDQAIIVGRLDSGQLLTRISHSIAPHCHRR